jgi:hypothetical protein
VLDLILDRKVRRAALQSYGSTREFFIRFQNRIFFSPRYGSPWHERKLLPFRISVSSELAVEKETKRSDERYIAAFVPDGRKAS